MPGIVTELLSKAHVTAILDDRPREGWTTVFTFSPLTRDSAMVEVPTEGLERWLAGELIQDALPDTEPVVREILMTGYTQEDWDLMFPPDEEDSR